MKNYLSLILGSPFYGLVLYLYFYIILSFHKLDANESFLLKVLLFVLGAIEAFGLPFILSYIFKSKKFIAALLLSLFSFYYSLLSFYHIRMNSPADFGMTFNNADLLTNSNSWFVVKDVYQPWDFPQILLFTFLPWLPLLLNLFFKSHSQEGKNSKKTTYVLISGIIFSIAAIVFDYNSPNKYTQYFQSARHYFLPSTTPFSPAPNENIEFKNFVPQVTKNKDVPTVQADNIFIIFLESFNANYVENFSPDGKEYTPVFNKLIKDGLYFENFYANSMQTAKGQFATLCSQIPHSRLKDMVDFKDIKFKCLPELLKNLGYYTVFMQGLSDLKFDNTGNFLLGHGFEEVHAMNDEFITKEDQKYIWGWGVQDDILFKKALEYKGKIQKKKNFIALATISNHMKFKGIPEPLKEIYPNAGDQSPMEERFANSIHIADHFLKTFFDELDARGLRKNSLVILLGDHSFPMGEHHNYATENTFYNELFKTPLLIIGPGISPKRIPFIASQIDVAPTLLELLNITDIPSTFRGKSIFDFSTHVVPLIQPYDGRYISLIKDDKKFVYHARLNTIKVFDLKKDPKELTNIYAEEDNKSFFPWLKEILQNDLALEKEEHLAK